MSIYFSDWGTVFKILVVGTIAYLLLIIVLRIFGKRTLAKMNAFDFVVTVAFGSILATILTSRDLTLFDGTLAFTLLVVLQFILTKLTIYFKLANKIVKSKPTLLFYKDEFDVNAMQKERVSKEEILQAVRSAGFASLKDILGVVLETTGEFSVLRGDSDYPESSTLENIDKSCFLSVK
ncbi:DUF421 domain-containing protein [Carnobacterium funditum]|uniref:DUF421 domain-containing protein n=1 Tax=Carnobacterium funditum TaxID=2752 RepID=UPI0005521AEC|nr:YetF domain-containing protein [Carnobacterium funditum]